MADDPQALAFACLHCGRILEFMADPPLQEQTVSAFAQLPTSVQLDDEFKARERKALDNMLESFVVVPSQPRKQEGQGWDKRIQALTKLFEIASDKCQLDHPLCRDCSDELLKELDGRIRELQQDNSAYGQRLDELNRSGPGRSSAEQEAMEKAELEKEEQLKAQLLQLRQEREAIRQERIQLDKEEKNLSQFETRFWQEYQDFQRDLAVINDEMQTYTQRLENSKEQLERMKRTNVLDDAFHIYYDGHFGTINGFRLGRLPSQPVDWVETNAAFGQVVLLLHTIAKQSKYTFQKYRLHPLGSFSKVSKIDGDNTAYELYGSNDLNISRLFWYRRFDTALVWLLECIAEFGDHASKIDPSFRLKYPIRGENIDGISVKLQFNQDAKWTKALKYMLTNLKFILAWVSKHQDH